MLTASLILTMVLRKWIYKCKSKRCMKKKKSAQDRVVTPKEFFIVLHLALFILIVTLLMSSI